ncbi:hypothetical protein [Methylocaldum szegediense]|uniref:Uncharacterized protein n=1 Tax=Methylocaldum szegediense TaxID=73780 RepID=A0ABN8X2C4_9GAMM|nr:hypothetical protein [Methylocaldum szegediense]CAI8821753.1 conserved protein of unknown function [Methylocaldum szegediense]
MNKQDVFRRCLISAVLGIWYGCTPIDVVAPRAVDHSAEPYAAYSKSVKHQPPVTGYLRPFGPNAPWNRPVKVLPRHPQSDVLAERLWMFGPSRPGNFNLSFSGYTYPVYTVDSATVAVWVQAGMGNLNGTQIPWNPNWRAASGSDSQVIILDPATGREWDLWQVNAKGTRVFVSNGNLVPGSYLTKEDGFKPSRGCGIPYLAMLVRPEEIAQGKIEHALSMPIRNTAQTFVPPATKSDGKTTENGIPMGTRFALDITDAEIDAWVNSLPRQLPLQTRRSARIIAVALRDYGWFITDTAGGAHFQFEDYATAQGKWEELGLGERSIGWKNYPTDLLDGLITRERIYAIAPSN